MSGRKIHFPGIDILLKMKTSDTVWKEWNQKLNLPQMEVIFNKKKKRDYWIKTLITKDCFLTFVPKKKKKKFKVYVHTISVRNSLVKCSLQKVNVFKHILMLRCLPKLDHLGCSYLAVGIVPFSGVFSELVLQLLKGSMWNKYFPCAYISM